MMEMMEAIIAATTVGIVVDAISFIVAFILTKRYLDNG